MDDQEILRIIGARLKEAREDAGLTSEDASMLLQNRRLAAEIEAQEAGLQNCLDALDIQRLCLYYNISPQWLLAMQWAGVPAPKRALSGGDNGGEPWPPTGVPHWRQ